VLEDVFHQHITLALGITDIDDKIIQRAKERKLVGVQAVQSMVRQLEHEFFVDMAKLNVLPPSAVLRVSEHIPDIIAYIQGIVEAGFAYHSPEHGVYFDVPKFGNRYGKLMHAVSTQENDQADNDTSAKKDIRDFALWKCAKAGEPSWASPWGNGRPGWHIECSAMTHNLFGRDVDIHSGGIDLKFPHHNNEIAQCEAFHNCDTWVRYWVHTGHLHIRGKGEADTHVSCAMSFHRQRREKDVQVTQEFYNCEGFFCRSALPCSAAAIGRQLSTFLPIAQV
jgi:cysteinyl-tRNA synthetase